MIDQRDATLSFGILIACGAAVAMAIGFWTWIGFILGVTSCLGAAAVANCDFE